MAGIRGLNKKFKQATAEIGMLSPSGEFPLFCIKYDDGKVDGVLGDWVEQPETDEIADGLSETIVPKCPKGATISRSKIILRNVSSPDAEKFRNDHHYFIKDDMYPSRKSKKNRKELSQEKKNQITAASCIADFVDIPCENEKTDTLEILKYTPENAMMLVKEHEVCMEQILISEKDKKKFDSV